MRVIVNGEPHEVADGATVASVLPTFTAAATGVAVALNDEVVSRGEWTVTPLRDQDRLEVLTAVQGG